MMTGAGGGAGSDSHTLYYVDTASMLSYDNLNHSTIIQAR